jgi:hypothetical protein
MDTIWHVIWASADPPYIVQNVQCFLLDIVAGVPLTAPTLHHQQLLLELEMLVDPIPQNTK